MNSISNRTVILFILLGSLLSPVFAANLPSGYPKLNEFQRTGTVDSLNFRAKKIVIGDQEFIIPANIIVVTPNKKNSTLRDIRLGKTAGIFFNAGTAERMPIVNEIWVLPRNF
jgi:hypothetical protein